MYRVFGFVTLFLLVLITAPYWFRQLNRSVLRIPMKKVLPFMKALRAIHKPLGLALLVVAATHGYMALRGFRLHTGTLALFSFVLTAGFGIAFFRTKKKQLLKIHRGFALLSVLLVLLHLFFPGAFYYVFG